MTAAAHTPVPWMAGEEIDACHIYSNDGMYSVIATTDGSDYPEAVENANAAFICLAVNSHAALVSRVAELEKALRVLVYEGECYCSMGTANREPCGHCCAQAALASKEQGK